MSERKYTRMNKVESLRALDTRCVYLMRERQTALTRQDASGALPLVSASIILHYSRLISGHGRASVLPSHHLMD